MRKFILILSIMLFTWILAPEIPIIYTSLTVSPAPADVLIVPGARLWGDQPSAMLRLRLDKAIELYHQGYARYFIVSGARGADEIDSEAAVMRNYLMRQGIPEHIIILEDRSFTTMQNLTFSHQIMQQQGWQTALIVTNPFHIYRSLVIAKQIGLQATAASAPSRDNPALNILVTSKQYLRESLAVTKHYIVHKRSMDILSILLFAILHRRH
jgi:uncharacterized SAM-binding protein YcdF (DUF218 family)